MKNSQGRTMRILRILEEARRKDIMHQALSELSKKEQTVALAVLKDMDLKLPDRMDNSAYAVASEQYFARLPYNQRIAAKKLLSRIEQLAKARGVSFD